MACHVTFNSNSDKGRCAIQIEWTKALCDNCQPMLKIMVYRSERSTLNIFEADSGI